MISTLTAYYSGRQIHKTNDPVRRKQFLLLSLFINLGILFAFKYFNFFNDSLRDLFNQFNIFYGIPAFNVLLPIGISFYTFQTLSYCVDVYREKQIPERHLGIFALYVSFFPQLVAGPIERSSNLLPQFRKEQKFSYIEMKNGILLVLWGLFKKLVIADRAAILVNKVYNHPHDYTGIPLIVAMFFFAIQIYCDFSGYSDIAIGSAQMMGYKLTINFNRPYFSKSIQEFWSRWHITLYTWFTDYLFTPLTIAFRHWGNYAVIFAISVTFLLCGLWHGAAWTFVIFGGWHALGLSLEMLTKKSRKRLSQIVPRWLYDPVSMSATFLFVCFTMIFFRANSPAEAVYIVTHLFQGLELKVGGYDMGLGATETLFALVFIFLLFCVQLLQARIKIREWVAYQPIWFRWSAYYVLIFSILIFGRFESSLQFVYFQF